MPPKSLSRGIDLRNKLKQVRANETVQLPLKDSDFGEYQGPFILDRPLTLIGKGDKTPLGAKGSPAIIVLSPGVRLVNLELSDTYDVNNGISLLVEEKAQPILDTVIVHGKREMMSKDHLIDLGDVIPKQKVTTFIELEISGPSTIKLADNCSRWLQTDLASVPAAGKYVMTLYCDTSKIGADAYAAGNFEIRTGTGSRVIWLTLHVLPATPLDLLTGPIGLRIGKDQVYRFADGFVIGKHRFPNIAAANSLAERQAVVLSEGPNCPWALYQPWITSTTTTVDNQPVSQGQRVLLKNGSVIKAGSLELKVESFKGAGSYSVTKSMIDLGTQGSPVDTGFQIRYNGSGKDKVKIISTIPWLQVSPSDLELKKDEVKDINVSLTQAVSNLTPIKHRERSAILVQSKHETLGLDAMVDVKAQTIIPRAVPDSIKLGTVAEWNKGQVSVTIHNDGTENWEPAVKLDKDWLGSDTTNLVIPAGKSAVFNLRLNQNVESLPSPSDQAAVLSLEGGGVILKLNVSLRLQLLFVDPVLETPLIDFHELDDYDHASPQTIIIRNKGTKNWTATAQTAKWLEVVGSPNILVEAGKQKTLMVRLTHNLSVGEHTEDAVDLQGDGKTLKVKVHVKLKPPTSEIDIQPRGIDFGQFDDWRAAVPQQFRFQNRGTAPWNGQLRLSAPWLDIQPEQGVWNCGPKAEQVFTLRINDQIPPGPVSIANAVTFEGPGGPFRVPVNAQLNAKAKPRSMDLDFGDVTGWESAAQITLPVFNDGNLDWLNVPVTCNVSWLTVTPTTISVPKGSKAELRVRLNERVNELASGNYQKDDALTLTQDSITLKIATQLTLPPVELYANSQELFFKIDDIDDDAEITRAIARIAVENRGRRDWKGAIKTGYPWLKLDPEQAEIPAGSAINLIASLTNEVRTLGTGEQLLGSLVTFEKSSFYLNGTIQIKRKPQVSDDLEFEPQPLDFGKLEEGANASGRYATLTIFCERDWQAKVDVQDNWFRPAVENTSGFAKTNASLRLELTSEAEQLVDGVHWSEVALTNQKGRRFTVPVKIEKVEVSPDLRLTPPYLDLAYHVAEGEPQTLHLRVKNNNNKEWKLILSSFENWVDIQPVGPVNLPANGSAAFSISLSENGKSLKEGKYSQDLTLRIGSKHRLQVPVSLLVDRSVFDWDISPEGIAFEKVERSPQWNVQEPQELIVRNKGNKEIVLSFSITSKSEQWLELPRSIRVPPHSERKVKVSLKRDAYSLLRLGNQQGIIDVHGAGHPTQIVATLQLVPQSEAPLVIQPILETSLQPIKVVPKEVGFTEMDPAKWKTVPAQTVIVENPNGVEIIAQARCVDWLSVEPRELCLKPYSSMSLEILLKPSLFNRTMQPYNLSDAVVIHYGAEKQDICVMVDEKYETPAPLPTATESETPTSIFLDEQPIPERPRQSVLFGGRKSTLINHRGPQSEEPREIGPQPQSGGLEVQPRQLDFGRVRNWSLVTHQEVQVKNTKAENILVKIKTAEWLRAEPEELICPAFGQVAFRVHLHVPKNPFALKSAQKSEGFQSDATGVIVISDSESIPVFVTVETL
jgi:hypothetical protein